MCKIAHILRKTNLGQPCELHAFSGLIYKYIFFKARHLHLEEFIYLKRISWIDHDRR